MQEPFRVNGWFDMMKTFLVSDDFDKIFNELYKLVLKGDRFTPPLKQVFSCFEKCNYDDLKIVIVAEKPYSAINVCDGMALSCSNTPKQEMVMRYLFESLYGKEAHLQSSDLTRWAEQGVLLLNSALTIGINKKTPHHFIWDDFMVYLIDSIQSKKDIIWILMGEKAQTFAPLIETGHIFYCDFPDNINWFKADAFFKANEALISNNQKEIVW